VLVNDDEGLVAKVLDAEPFAPKAKVRWWLRQLLPRTDLTHGAFPPSQGSDAMEEELEG
jgi:hypothetical protein